MEALEGRTLLAADLRIVKDIMPGSDGSLTTSSPALDVTEALGDAVYFSAFDITHGQELWKTDGTEANTAIVQDFTPGAGGTYPANLLAANGSLYFTGYTGSANRLNLYRLDGATGQISTVKANIVLAPGYFGSDSIIRVGDTVFFMLDLENGRNELWKTDGTESGTVLVKSNLNPSFHLYSFEGHLLFISVEGANGVLWQSGGTEETTTTIAGSPPMNQYASFRWAELNGSVFFTVLKSRGTPRSCGSWIHQCQLPWLLIAAVKG